MTGTRTAVTRIRVCHVDDLAPGEKRLVHNGRREVLLCRAGDGSYYAVGNACPHQGAALCGGTLAGTTTAAAVGRYAYAFDGEVVRCPWHAWEFDVRTGNALFVGSDERIATYDVSIEDDDVFVAAAARRRRDATTNQEDR